MAYIIGTNIDTRRLSFPTDRRSDPRFALQPTTQLPDDDDWSRQISQGMRDSGLTAI